MEIKKITDDEFYIPNPANIGLIETNEGVILIDTRLDDSTGKKVLKTLEEKGMYPTAIINTHF